MTRIHRSFRTLLLAGIAAGALAACDSGDPTEANETPVGSLTLIPNMRAEDISADGKTVLMTDLMSAGVDFYLYDVASGTSTLGGSAGDWMNDFTTGISNHQRVSALHGKPVNAGLWQNGTWLDLGNTFPAGCEYDDVTHEQDLSSAWDIDSAGHGAVGMVWNLCDVQAFYWSDAGGVGGFTLLDLLGTGMPIDTLPGEFKAPQNRATVISDDGVTIGGWGSDTATVEGVMYYIDRRPAVWTNTGTGYLLTSTATFPQDCTGEVLAIGGNGTTVAGTWCQKAFVWTAAGGAVNLSGDLFGWGQAVALDGQLVFGTNSDSPFWGINTPFVWTQAGGVKSLADVAAENDIVIPSTYMWQSIVAASADGTVVVGALYDEAGTFNTFVLKLPVSVYGL